MPNIIQSKFVKTLNELKSKTPEIDDISIELLKEIGKDIKCKLLEIIEKMFRDGNIPENITKTKFY